jgi:hypothetical protein
MVLLLVLSFSAPSLSLLMLVRKINPVLWSFQLVMFLRALVATA